MRNESENKKWIKLLFSLIEIELRALEERGYLFKNR